MRRRAFCKAATAIPALIAWKTHASLMMVSGNRAVTVESGGAVGHGYTATHYVEITAAGGDPTDEQNATAYSNATDPETPCTLQCALVNAVAGNVIEIGPGVYEKAQTTEDATTAIWTSYDTGSSGSPIIFTARYPAAQNRGSPELWTEPRRTAGDLADWIVDQNSQSPLLGGGGIGSYKSYVIWDGFYFNHEISPPSPTGLVMLRGNGGTTGTGLEARRMLFDRYDWTQQSIEIGGNNFNSVQCHTTVNVRVVDCYFRNTDEEQSADHNESCITQYACSNYLFENNTFDNVHTAIFIKGGGTQDPYGTVRYNKFIDCDKGLLCLQNSATEDADIYQNLFYLTSVDADFEYHIQFDATSSMEHWNLYSNTIVLRSVGSAFTINGQDGTNIFRDNIVAHVSGTPVTGPSGSGWMINSQVSLAGFGDIDYNWYWHHSADEQWNHSGQSYTIADWRTSVGDDANCNDAGSTLEDPEFEDATTFDFRLAVGSPCLEASSIGGPVGCYITGSEELGARANPAY